jgi:hypothetical protein
MRRGAVNVFLAPMGAAHTAVGGTCECGVAALSFALCATSFTKSGNCHLGAKWGENPKKVCKKVINFY